MANQIKISEWATAAAWFMSVILFLKLAMANQINSIQDSINHHTYFSLACAFLSFFINSLALKIYLAAC